MPIFKSKFYPSGHTIPPVVPMGLTQTGPMVQVQIEVSTALSKRLLAEHAPVSQPETGNALVDTGATFSAIDVSIAKRLNLEPIGTATTGTAAGKQTVAVFALKISIPGARIAVEDGHVLGVDLDGTGVIALLGRSFLQNVIFIYDGPSGEFTIAL